MKTRLVRRRGERSRPLDPVLMPVALVALGLCVSAVSCRRCDQSANTSGVPAPAPESSPPTGSGETSDAPAAGSASSAPSCDAGCKSGDGCCPANCSTATDSDCLPPAGGIPDERRIAWHPGLPGGIPSRTRLCATIDAAKFGNGTTDATEALKSAIEGCPEGQVVSIPEGRYRLTDTLEVGKGIVLRGAGPKKTKLVVDNPQTSMAIHVGGWTPENPSPRAVAVTAGFYKGSTELTLETSAPFSVGDLVLIDQHDDPALVVTGDCTDSKRSDDAGPRSVGQIAEVVSKTPTSVKLSSPLHYNYAARFKPELVLWNGTSGRVKYPGVEDLYITRSSNFPQQYPYAQFILIRHAAYAWVKNVETEKVAGRHIELDSCYRCEVRDSYVHHAYDYEPGGYAYGIVLDTHTSDSLVENNIVRYLTLPVTLANTGGGNVIAYNYVDDALIPTFENGVYKQGATLSEISDWQMPDIGTHCSFPHMELFEGNWLANFQLDDVHGGSGYLTFFRNYASGRHAPPLKDHNNSSAFALWRGNYYANIVGNVAWTSGLEGQYEGGCTLETPAVFRLGPGPTSDCSVDARVAQTLFRHGNYDFVTGLQNWDRKVSDHDLPASLYLSAKPAFFGDNPWPYVTPEAANKVGVLPAKVRFDRGP